MPETANLTPAGGFGGYLPRDCPTCGQPVRETIFRGENRPFYGHRVNVIDMDRPFLRCANQHEWRAVFHPTEDPLP